MILRLRSTNGASADADIFNCSLHSQGNIAKTPVQDFERAHDS